MHCLCNRVLCVQLLYGKRACNAHSSTLINTCTNAVLPRRSKPSKRTDGIKLGLAIEGGGMRGCVSAGMVTCLHHLGLADAFDAVYGSSAGCLVGKHSCLYFYLICHITTDIL
jgi:tRNA-binding EMAP/Myf-like protein